MIYAPQVQQTLITEHQINHQASFVLAGMSLGKTSATLDTFNKLRCDGEVRAMMVVAPLRVARLTWPNEIAKWGFSKNLRVEHLQGECRPSGKAHIYLINYEQLTKTVLLGKHKRTGEPVYGSKSRLRDLSFCDMVVMDEITKLKGNKSVRGEALRELFTPRHRRIGLTGTPRPNGVLDLFGQVRMLDDGRRLGPSFDLYKKTWCEAKDYHEHDWQPKPGSEEKIYQRIADLAITLRSSDYLDLPDTVIEDVEVSLPESAQGIYRELEKELLAILANGEEVVAPTAATLVTKLRQITGGSIYTGDKDVGDRQTVHVHDAKVKALQALLKRLPGENCLIATNYVHERERVVAALPGAVDAAKFKGDIEDAWNSGAIRYLVADPRSLGHGLNMQKGGRTVVWFSPTYSREDYDQFNARIARKGQDGVPLVYRLVCSGTIDDAIVEVLRSKGEGQAAMLELLSNFRKLSLLS